MSHDTHMIESWHTYKRVVAHIQKVMVYAISLMTLAADLGLSLRVSMLEFVRLVTGTSSGRAASFIQPLSSSIHSYTQICEGGDL